MKRQKEDQPGPSRYLSTSSIDSIKTSASEIKRREEKEAIDQKIYQKNLENKKLELAPPFRGTIGRSVRLLTNCYKLHLKKKRIYHYDVSIRIQRKSGEALPKKKSLKRDIFWHWLLTVHGSILNVKLEQVCFDDEHSVFTTKQFQKNKFDSNWRPDEQLEYEHGYSSARGNFTVKIIITYRQFIDFVDTENTRNFVTTPIIQHIISNVVTQFWRIPEGMQPSFYCMGKEIIRLHLNNAYQPLEVDLIGKLFEGLSVRVKAGIKGMPYINLGLIHRVLLSFDLPVIQFYALVRGERMFSEEQLNWLSQKRISFNESQVAAFNANFGGVDIKTTYNPVRHYTVDSLADGSANSTKFEINGDRITVREYYASKYNIELRFPDLQLIKARGRETYIPIELCHISMRPQKVHTQLSPSTLRAICQKATNDPRAYFNKVTRMSQLALLENTLVQEEFGVEIPVVWDNNNRAKLNPMEIKGRVLPRPICRYEEPRPLERKVLEPAQRAYLIACTVNIRNLVNETDFVHELLNVSYQMQQRFINEQNIQYESRTFNSFEDVRLFVNNMCNVEDSKFDRNRDKILFLFILGSNSDNLYSWIKRVGDVDRGVFTQCINGEELKNKRGRFRQMCANLVAKINCRLGGVMNEIGPDRRRENPCNNAFEKYTNESEPTLFLGLFTSKPRGEESVFTITFNKNCEASKFVGIYGFFSKSNDFIDELDRSIYDVLAHFCNSVKRLPSKVLFFRSGLTDNLVDFVSDFEVQKFKDGWKRFLERNEIEGRKIKYFEPSILYVNVERNHKLRFQQQDSDQRSSSYQRQYGQIEKGVVIDYTWINSPSGDSFYLCSHKGLLGTSKPAFYEIKHNEWNVNLNELPDELQPVIFSLCYMVQRSVQTVSLPAPIYYSKLLSERVLQYLKTTDRTNELQPHRTIADTTFFT